MATIALSSTDAAANGRFPGATQLVLRGDRGVMTTSFGLLSSNDKFTTPSWSCEQSIGYNPAENNDIGAGIFGDGTIVLSGPAGVTISTDLACTNPVPNGPIADRWFVDVTIDGANATSGLVVSRGGKLEQCGHGELLETLDNGRNFALISTLPEGFCPLTLDSAPSDPQRIYISGNVLAPDGLKLIGRMLVTDDRGKNWSSYDVPNEPRPFIGAVDPIDRDTVYLRTSIPPANGRLMVSNDAAKNFREIALLTGLPLQFFGVTGLALSPDGSKLAYGSVNEGLYIMPTKGGGAAEKVSSIPVMCLTWTDDGLYACSAPNLCGPFFVGLSHDEGRTFETRLPSLDVNGDETKCAPGTPQAVDCPSAWAAVEKRVQSCSDGGTTTPPPVDAGQADAGAPAPKPPQLDCDCHVGRAGDAAPPAALTLAGVLLAIGRRRSRTASSNGARR